MKSKIFLACLLSMLCAWAQADSLCAAVTSTGKQSAKAPPAKSLTFQGSMTVTSGAGTAAVTIEGSLDGLWFDSVGTLAITDLISDSITFVAPRYVYYRCNVTGLTGTGASVAVNYGY